MALVVIYVTVTWSISSDFCNEPIEQKCDIFSSNGKRWFFCCKLDRMLTFHGFDHFSLQLNSSYGMSIL